MKLIIITGLSGAGKTQVVHCFEDIGYYCIDNMPPKLLTKFAEVCLHSGGKIDKVALVMDIRGREMFDEIFSELENLRSEGYEYEILFLDANNETLVSRYKESRRKHPLADENGILDGIIKERKILERLKSEADYVIDTSNMLPRQLKEQIFNIFAGKERSAMSVTILSFGFKYGIPLDADMVFDVRFLPNPFYVPELKPLTGLDKAVDEYVMKDEATKQYCAKILDIVEFVIPKCIEEGKMQFIIAIGCTGGRHRSVSIARWLYSKLKGRDVRVSVEHRDLTKHSS